MAKVGYIFNSEQYDTFTFDRAWMEKYGCCRIIEDNASQEKTRPEWKQLMDCLERGDELVISKFSNALRELLVAHYGKHVVVEPLCYQAHFALLFSHSMSCLFKSRPQ